jgi:hypothetical protein
VEWTDQAEIAALCGRGVGDEVEVAVSFGDLIRSPQYDNDLLEVTSKRNAPGVAPAGVASLLGGRISYAEIP